MFLHMVWECPVVKNYWEKVMKLINLSSDRSLIDGPMLCILWHHDCTKAHKVTDRYADLALVLARRQITMSWKAPVGPSITRWKAELDKWTKCEGVALGREESRGLSR